MRYKKKINMLTKFNPKWSIKDVIVTILFYFFLISIVNLIPLKLFTSFISFIQRIEWNQITKYLIIPIFLLVDALPDLIIGGSLLGLIYFFVKRKYNVSLRELGYKKERAFWYILIGLIAGSFLIIISRSIGYIFIGEPFFHSLSRVQLFKLFNTIFIKSLFASIYQETLFAGFAYPVFRRKFGVILGILITLCIFVLTHIFLPNLIIVFANCFIYGFIYLILYEKTGSIVPSISAHFIGNLLSHFQ